MTNQGKSGFKPTSHKTPLSRLDMTEMGLRGINCGSGKALHQGILNTDIMQLKDTYGNQAEAGCVYTYDNSLFYLQHDQTEPLPLESESCDYVFSEHFIEHISPDNAVAWLTEVNRILKPGGIARISTPDLALYIHGYTDPEHSFYSKHKLQLEKMGLRDCTERPAWMINQIFRYYGHQWIYDKDEVTLVATLAGFEAKSVRRCHFQNGSIPEIAKLDQEVRSDESLYIEIEKSNSQGT